MRLLVFLIVFAVSLNVSTGIKTLHNPITLITGRGWVWGKPTRELEAHLTKVLEFALTQLEPLYPGDVADYKKFTIEHIGVSGDTRGIVLKTKGHSKTLRWGTDDRDRYFGFSYVLLKKDDLNVEVATTDVPPPKQEVEKDDDNAIKEEKEDENTNKKAKKKNQQKVENDDDNDIKEEKQDENTNKKAKKKNQPEPTFYYLPNRTWHGTGEARFIDEFEYTRRIDNAYWIRYRLKHPRFSKATHILKETAWCVGLITIPSALRSIWREIRPRSVTIHPVDLVGDPRFVYPVMVV